MNDFPVGFSNNFAFWGVVEDNNDPMAIGRVRVRCFHIHPEDKTQVPTEDLPWALVLHPTTSSAISGIGETAPIQLGAWVYGFFSDGRSAQFPIVTHTVPGVHRPNSPSEVGGSGAGYVNQGESYGSGGQEVSPAEDLSRPYHNEITEGYGNPTMSDSLNLPLGTNSANQGEGALVAHGDTNIMLTLKDKPKWTQLGLTTYTWEPAPRGYACKDGKGSLRFHYGTALALERLTKNFGKGKLSITSAYRTVAYNATRRGAAKNSMHTHGQALDISLGSIGGQSEIARFAAMAVKCGFVGFGLYSSFIHIDTGKARVWKGATAAWFMKAIKDAGWHKGKKGLEGVKTNPGASEEENPSDVSNQNTTDPAQVKTQSDAEKYTYNYLKGKGYTDAQTAGIMANLHTESNFNVNALNPNDKGLPSYGLAQWRGDRMENLFNYTGTRSPNIQQQLDFMHHELNTSHRPALSALNGATTPAQAAYGFGSKYEVYQGYASPNSPSSLKRIAKANEYAGSGYNSGSNAPQKGYVDPTNSLPSPEYRGQPSTNQAARGYNRLSDQREIARRDAGRLTGFPAAGDIGTFGEPELRAGPQYPYNNVKSSRAGHMLEMDDTPDMERVYLAHKSGSGVEMFADGDISQRSVADMHTTVGGNSYTGVIGKYMLTSQNDMHIRSTGDLTQQADGSMNILMGNDGSLIISGDFTLSVGEDIRFKAAKIVFEGDTIDILSNGNMNLQAKGEMNVRGATVAIHSEGEMGLKATTVNADDIVRVGEGKAKEVAGASTADVGKAPERTVVNKDNLTTTTNRKKSTTSEEVAEHYSRNRGEA